MNLVLQTEETKWKEAVNSMIAKATSILITSIKSDDDAISSVLSLYSIFRSKWPDKKTKMAICSYKNERYANLRHFESIHFTESLEKYYKDFNLIFFLDSSELHRFGLQAEGSDRGGAEALKKENIETICIDHHFREVPRDAFSLACVSTKATSSTELVYKLFVEDQVHIDEHLAETLLVGLMGDTGSLRYISQDKIHVYEIIKRLISEKNLNLSSLVFLWRKCTSKQYEVVRRFMTRAHIFRKPGWPPFTAAYIPRKVAEKAKYTHRELNEAASFYISHLGMVVDDADWAIVLYPHDDGTVKIKVRTNPAILSAYAICKSLEIGSGHAWASGGTFPLKNGTHREPLECLNEFLDFLNTHTYDKLSEKVETKAQ